MTYPQTYTCFYVHEPLHKFVEDLLAADILRHFPNYPVTGTNAVQVHQYIRAWFAYNNLLHGYQ